MRIRRAVLKVSKHRVRVGFCWKMHCVGNKRFMMVMYVYSGILVKQYIKSKCLILHDIDLGLVS